MNIFGRSCYSLAPALEAGDARATGMLLGAAGLGSLVSAVCIMPFFQGFKRPGLLLSGAILWMGSTLALVASVPILPLQLLFMFALGLSTTVLFVTTLGLLQTIPPVPSRGTFFGLFSAVFFGTQPVAALLLAHLADRDSTRHTIRGSAIVEIVGALILLLLPQWRKWTFRALKTQWNGSREHSRPATLFLDEGERCRRKQRVTGARESRMAASVFPSNFGSGTLANEALLIQIGPQRMEAGLNVRTA